MKIRPLKRQSVKLCACFQVLIFQQKLSQSEVKSILKVVSSLKMIYSRREVNNVYNVDSQLLKRQHQGQHLTKEVYIVDCQ